MEDKSKTAGIALVPLSHSALTLRSPLWCRSRRTTLRTSLPHFAPALRTLSSPLCGRPCVWPKGDLGGCRSRRTTLRTRTRTLSSPLCGRLCVWPKGDLGGCRSRTRTRTPLSLVVSFAQCHSTRPRLQRGWNGSAFAMQGCSTFYIHNFYSITTYPQNHLCCIPLVTLSPAAPKGEGNALWTFIKHQANDNRLRPAFLLL